ncbi:right-handed parallel beta-helix repeat-containing protein [Streptomyces sp. NBC_00249]|uniref:right-handed parallel beta-helix repeat-containing protein n=1 Tax=Streptomyces sp. NBC_00249 TaxID=2975690 RepID=UPI0022526E23|nr:right-handed parallel beta-helix repeat-containing protein [Streptomyces sp. NBC_00249]MCX5192348.1 right-handed parallel beta-helix repeat-containing protein [Streptomyces sp. NBC_00249]
MGSLLGGMALVAAGALVPASAAAKPRDLVVPTAAYPTIQSAVDAASPGDHIAVRPGVYREQVSIAKDVTLTGAGAKKTTIRAPQQLVTGADGLNSIVTLDHAAHVKISGLAVSGPGSGTCDAGALGAGIRVLGGAHLDLSHARVTHIQDTPMAPCFHSANAILIGALPVGTGSAAIRDSEITDYQGSGIVVLNEGSHATLLRNVVTGQKRLSTDGIEFVGAIGRIEENVVSDNACREPDPGCGTDFFNDVQHAGILAGGAGTVIAKNRLSRNQLGIYAFDTAEIRHNNLIDNEFFGMALQDGTFTATKDTIRGGVGGVAAIASAVDTTARLDHVKITKTSGDPIQTFECCGFTATVTAEP